MASPSRFTSGQHDNQEPHADPSPCYDYLEYGPDPDAPVRGAHAMAGEVAVAISYNGINQAVMMATPDHLEDFITGFTLTSGLIDDSAAIYDIQLSGEPDAVRAEVTLSSRAFATLKRQHRAQAGTGGCGLCGVEALEQALPALPVRIAALPPSAHFQDLRARFAAAQTLAHHSGAMHAALYVDGAGETRLCREDIGRHNALDKLIGACARQGLALDAGFLAITSRCGLELIHKTVRAGAGTLVSLSSPSSLSVRQARRCHLNLIHQPRQGAPRLYSPAPRGPKEEQPS